MKYNPFSFIGKIKSSIKIEDFSMSRYLPIYKYHSKRAYKQFLEEKTIERANKLIEENFPKRIKKEVKIKLIDCVVIFLKYITVKYDYYPNDVIYTKEFEKIIAYNFAKILNN
jgi:hypothetical protein